MNRKTGFLVIAFLFAICVASCGGKDAPAFRGPINQGYAKPVVIVVPTQERTAELNELIGRFVALAREKLGGFTGSEILTDQQALTADLSGKSVVVYGTPTGNAFLAKHMPDLPLTVTADKVELGGEVEGKNLRVIMTWPNPQDPSRAMTVYTAQRAEDINGINAVHHGGEDWLIARDGTEVVCRGIYRKNNGVWSSPAMLPLDRPSWDYAFAPTRLTVSGTPEQIGTQIGQAFSDKLTGMIPLVLEMIKSQANLTCDEQVYARAERVAAEMDPADLDELRALAEAAGVDYRDVLSVNLYYTLNTAGRACRQVAAWGQATADGRLLHGRNLDWPDTPHRLLSRHHVILNVRPLDGIEYVILTWPGFTGALTGTNQAGLTVAANSTYPMSNNGRRAEPAFFTLKRILRTCRTVDEAVEVLRAARPMDDMSVLISQANDPAAVVAELWGGRVCFRQPADGEQMIGNANHPTTDACPYGRAHGPADFPTCSASRQVGLPLSIERTRQVLAHPTVLAELQNLLSVVFDPTMNRMYLSCGRLGAAKGEYGEYELFADMPVEKIRPPQQQLIHAGKGR